MKLPELKDDFINDIVYEESYLLEWKEVMDIQTGRVTRKEIRSKMSAIFVTILNLFRWYASDEKPDYFHPEIVDEMTDRFIAEVKEKYEA